MLLCSLCCCVVFPDASLGGEAGPGGEALGDDTKSCHCEFVPQDLTPSLKVTIRAIWWDLICLLVLPCPVRLCPVLLVVVPRIMALTLLHCTILYGSVLYYTVLYYALLYYSVLCCTVLYPGLCQYYTVILLYCTVVCVLYCTILYLTVLCCTWLYCTVVYSGPCQYKTIPRLVISYSC